MTDVLHDYSVDCQLCGKTFEMTWGKDNDVCEECESKSKLDLSFSEVVPVQKYFIDDSGHCIMVDPDGRHINLTLVQEFYANPENWRRFPVEPGGFPEDMIEYWWIGDGGEFARGGENKKEG